MTTATGQKMEISLTHFMKRNVNVAQGLVEIRILPIGCGAKLRLAIHKSKGAPDCVMTLDGDKIQPKGDGHIDILMPDPRQPRRLIIEY